MRKPAKTKRIIRRHNNNNTDHDENDESTRELKRELLTISSSAAHHDTTVAMKEASANADECVVEESLIEAEIESNKTEIDMKKRLVVACQKVLVPSFFALVQSALAYFLVGLFSDFDAIRYYSYFLGILTS